MRDKNTQRLGDLILKKLIYLTFIYCIDLLSISMNVQMDVYESIERLEKENVHNRMMIYNLNYIRMIKRWKIICTNASMSSILSNNQYWTERHYLLEQEVNKYNEWSDTDKKKWLEEKMIFYKKNYEEGVLYKLSNMKVIFNTIYDIIELYLDDYQEHIENKEINYFTKDFFMNRKRILQRQIDNEISKLKEVIDMDPFRDTCKEYLPTNIEEELRCDEVIYLDDITLSVKE